MPQPSEVILKGVIIPVEWDKDGAHRAVALAADDEQEYRISRGNKNGRSLFRLLQRRVGIKGSRKPHASPDKRNVITVTEYQVIEDNQF